MEVRKGPGQLIQVQELEGELRKVTSFWSSKRRTYRLKAHILLVRKQQKNGVSEYKTKYDLSLYTVKLSVKDNLKFRLVPKDTNAKKVSFRALSNQDRTRWFTAICRASKENELESLNFNQSFKQLS
jgi:PH domain